MKVGYANFADLDPKLVAIATSVERSENEGDRSYAPVYLPILKIW